MPEQMWVLNDSAPTTLAQAAGVAPNAWAETWWGPYLIFAAVAVIRLSRLTAYPQILAH